MAADEFDGVVEPERFWVESDWHGGLCLKDPRRIKRVTNIHTDNDDANAFDIRIFRQAKNAFAGKTDTDR